MRRWGRLLRMARARMEAHEHSIHDHGRRWYSGAHYEYGQYYSTFIQSGGQPRTENIQLLDARMKQLVPTPQTTVALEIGPGNFPFIERFPFKQKVYVEQSERIAQKLQMASGIREYSAEKSPVVRATIRELPFAPGRRFGVVVLNEVLTHVDSAERLKVIKQIASHTNSILLVDRPYPAAGSPLWPVSPGEISTFARKEEVTKRTYVQMEPIVEYLRSNGWDVQIERIYRGAHYAILSARRITA